MSNNNQLPETDNIVENEKFQNSLSASISLAVDIKALFELYAYRVITPEYFIQEVISLSAEHKNKIQ